ncbi:hypothetical protein DFH09DRAFT_1153728 [Mycena vulgaris]|nr:hypothetical protein DFH09DRAFT_1153728 [Mycena vulgaris]
MDVTTRPPALDVQELWYHIIGFLRGMTPDLKTLALVSRAFCAPAQSVLFHAIDLQPNSYEYVTRTRGGAGPEAFDAACRRLGAVLAESPHLAKYIHRLKVTLTADVLAQLCAMGLSSLQDIAIKFRRADHSLIEPLQALIGLPSVRQVTLSSHVSSRVFCGRISHLTALAFYHIMDGSPPEAQDIRAPRPEIKTLRLHNSVPVEHWLVGPACPFDLTRLVDVDIWVGYGPRNTMNASLLHILDAARLTIERLTLLSCSFQERPLDLAQYPNLTHLHIHDGRDFALAFIATSIPSLDGHPSLRSITLQIKYFSQTEWTTVAAEETLRSIDAAFDAISLPALKQFEILLSIITVPTRVAFMSAAERDALFRRGLPSLSASGLLSVVEESRRLYPRTAVKRA